MGRTMITAVRNGEVYTGAAAPGARRAAPSRRVVSIEGGTIVQLDATDPTRAEQAGTLDAEGCLVVPGLVDVQVNGFAGIDLTTTPEQVAEVASALCRYGVTSFAPTLISCPADTVRRGIDAVRGAHESEPCGARILGLHLEGPFLNPTRRGAHPARYLREPDPAVATEWAATGQVCLTTLAPELPRGLETVLAFNRLGVVVCAGHSAATLDEVDVAFVAGMRGITHIFNAMPGIDHRRPGLVLAGLGSRDLTATIIVDDVHVNAEVVNLAWRASRGRLILVTDAIAAAGLHDGRFTIGGTVVTVADGVARTADGTLAGSTLTLDAAIRNLIRATGCSITEAVDSATAAPASLLRRGDIGSIEPGHPADLVLLDEHLHVAATVVGGRLVYDRDGRVRARARRFSPAGGGSGRRRQTG